MKSSLSQSRKPPHPALSSEAAGEVWDSLSESGPPDDVPFASASVAALPIISEIMYHPQSDDDREEYIELFNPGPTAIDLTGWRFTDGVDFVFPSVTVAGGEYLVVAADVAAFAAKYPDVSNVVGGWSGQLSNRGEDIELENAAGILIDQVHYSDQGEWAVRVEGAAWTRAIAAGLAGRRTMATASSLGIDQSGAAERVRPELGGQPDRRRHARRGELRRGTGRRSADRGRAPRCRSFRDHPTRSAVTARILDEVATGVTAILYYRRDGEPDYFHTLPMRGRRPAR